MATNLWTGWEQQVLALLGAPATSANVSFLDAWQQREGAAGYNFNPLATTWGGNGSVGSYSTPTQGAFATAQTLLSSDYAAILAALRSGNPASGDQASIGQELLTWSGHAYSSVAGIGAGAKDNAPGGLPEPPGGTPALPGVGGSSSGSSPIGGASWSWLPPQLGDIFKGANPVSGVASEVLVGVAAFTLLAIGGLWLALGNQNTKEILVAGTKAAAEASG